MTDHKAVIVTDLGFGDSGKGRTVQNLVKLTDSDLVVRYNGGSQAAHSVVTRNGSHVFHQYGAGTLNGAHTYMTSHCLFNPIALFHEAKELESKFGRFPYGMQMNVDPMASVITPYHQIANRLRELTRGDNKHGSCGQGIGEAQSDRINYPMQYFSVSELLSNPSHVWGRLKWVREVKRAELSDVWEKLETVRKITGLDPRIEKLVALFDDDHEMASAVEVYGHVARNMITIIDETLLDKRFKNPGVTIFEGAQGVLLDENHGFNPYTTWSTTTSNNALETLNYVGFEGETTVLGVIRSYQTRHGKGPFPTYNSELTNLLQDPHNPTNTWQGEFRCGWLDLNLINYARRVNHKVDGLVITCLDQLPKDVSICTGYNLNNEPYFLKPYHLGHPLQGTNALTEDLEKVEPKYTHLSVSPDAYANYIARHLDIPLWMTSYGPGESDAIFCESSNQLIKETALV